MGNCSSSKCDPYNERDIEDQSVVKVNDHLPPLFVDVEAEVSTPLFDEAVEEDVKTMHEALDPLSKEEQLAHVLHSQGMLMMLDNTDSLQDHAMRSTTARAAIRSSTAPATWQGSGEEVVRCILESKRFSSSSLVAVILDQSALGRSVGETPMLEYLLGVKRVVPFVKLNQDVGENDCAQVLDSFVGAGVFGVEKHVVIHEVSEQAVTSLVEQQFAFAKLFSEKGLMPMLRIQVLPACPDRERCEKLLLEALLQSLRKVNPMHPGVLLSLTCPIRPNTYLPLLGHPKVLRIAAHDMSASTSAESCKALSQNLGFVANLSGREVLGADGEFLEAFDKFNEASRLVPAKEQQLMRVSMQDGFFVGLDHTARTARDALTNYGVDLPENCSDQDVFNAIHDMRSRIFRDPTFSGDRIVGAILSEDSLERKIAGMHTAEYLWEQKRVVPYLRLFDGLASEKNGVQMIKQVSKIDSLLDRAAHFGIFGTKMRSVIRLPKEAGIKAAVNQQFSVARTIMAKGLVPVLQIEIDIKSPNKVKCERLLYDALMDGLENLRHYERVILDLTVPSTPNTYLPLISHPNAIRVTSLSGGLPCQEACALLSQNVGLVASFGRAFIEELRYTMSGEEFSEKLEKSSVTVYNASVAVPTREMQLIKVSSTDGIFAPLDKTGSDLTKVLQRYGINTDDDSGKALSRAGEKRRARILTNPKINGSVFIGVSLFPEAMKNKIDGEPLGKYVWEQKNIVPFVKLSNGLRPSQNGVQLLNDMPQLDNWLLDAKEAGVFGTKMRSVIKLANRYGIREVVMQQFELSKRVFAHGLVPILMPEVDIKSPNKEECENILCDELLEALSNLRPDERVLFWLTLPSKTNKFLSVIHHPNCIRIIALSGGYSAEEATKLLADNVGMVGGFERGLFADIKADQSDSDFTAALDASCKAIFDASRTLSVKEEQMLKMGAQDGFVAAFDQNKNALPEVLQTYGLQRSAYKNDKEMLDKVFEMFARILTNSKFNGARVLGIVLREDFLDRDIDYMPCAKYLWRHKRIVPFLKVAKGLQPERDGVQLMKDVGQLDKILHTAAEAGVIGTKARSVIKKPNSHGIHEAIEQQFEIAKHVLARGMVPIMHIEVDIDAEKKTDCERMLRQALMGVLRQLEPQQKVMFQVTLPSTPNAYASLISHPNVIRVLAPSGGYTNAEACERLEQNPCMIASFGRALIQDLHVTQTDREFTQVLDRACLEVYDASRGATTRRKSEKRSSAKSPRSLRSPRKLLEREDAALGA